MVTKGSKQRNSPPRGYLSGLSVPRPKPLQLGNSNLSSTYQSFADTGPANSYLDLCRARSDESLLWSASEEAAALVAELRASINSPAPSPPSEDIPLNDIRHSCSPGGSGPTSPSWMSLGSPLRSRSFTDLQCSTSTEDVRVFCYHPSNVPYHINHCNGPKQSQCRVTSCSNEDMSQNSNLPHFLQQQQFNQLSQARCCENNCSCSSLVKCNGKFNHLIALIF